MQKRVLRHSFFVFYFMNFNFPNISFGFAFTLFVAAVLPWQIAFYAVPIVSFFDEAAAFAGWAILLLVFGKYLAFVRLNRATASVLSAIALLALAGLAQFFAGKIVWAGQVAQLTYFLAALALVFWSGSQVKNPQTRLFVMDYWAWCWLLGCGLGFVTALMQYFGIEVSERIIAPLADKGRIFGNVHQPNQFATLTALGLPCAVWLYQRCKLTLRTAGLMCAMIVLTVVLTSSRTGLVQLAWITAWILISKTASKRIATVVVWATIGAFGLLYYFDKAGVLPYFNSNRMTVTEVMAGNISNQRFQLWQDTWSLVLQNPWTGIGFGQFEFYRTFSDLPNDLKTMHVNAHLLPLQLAAEYGLPVAVVFFTLIGYALIQAKSAWRDPVSQCAMAGVVIVLIHSSTEFPLWYAFILLPFGFLLGLYFGGASSPDRSTEATQVSMALPKRAHKYAALAMLGGIVLGTTHYLPTVAMYVLNTKDITREDRLATAERAFLYKHWIVYNSIGGASYDEISAQPKVLLPLFDKSSRFYMNEFNMAQYALVLAENGRYEHATRVVAALRRLQSSKLPDLLMYCRSANTEGASRLSSIIENQVMPKLDARDF